MKKTLLAVSLVLALALASFGQSTTVTLSNTTLASAVTTTSQTLWKLSSTTGVVAAATLLYVEDGTGGNNETVFVNTVNTVSNIVSVTRGYNGTQANVHLAGSIVLYGGPPSFVYVNPSGTCTAASAMTPTVNIMTSTQWICSSISGSWVPGYFNRLYTPSVTTAVASVAGATQPTGPLFHVTGTNAITAWGSSTTAGLGAGGGASTSPTGTAFCVIPDAAFTTTATNNIAKASTAVANQVMCMTWDNTNKKFVPSY